MKVEIQKRWYGINDCLSNKHKLYVFGDNTIRTGHGGQASIRDIKNSIGIATKLLPSQSNNAYFSDQYEEYQIIVNDIEKMIKKFKEEEYEVLVLPYDGLGTGLSKMPEKSPELFKWMNSLLSEIFNITYPPK